MTNLILYHCPRACSSVTMSALEEAELEYKDVEVGYFDDEFEDALDQPID